MGIGNESTHWRTGTFGMTLSTRWAAASCMRRAPQGGQMPRRLQEKATSFSSRQPSHERRRKPSARMPQARNASNSSVTNVGRPAPPGKAHMRRATNTINYSRELPLAQGIKFDD